MLTLKYYEWYLAFSAGVLFIKRKKDMNELMKTYLGKTFEFETNGCIDEAIDLYSELLDVFPDSKEILLTEKAKMEFRNLRDKEALLDFIHAYAIGRNQDLYDLILEAYLNPNIEQLEEQYQKNIQLLQKYPFYKNDFDSDQLNVYTIWMDEEVICMVNVDERAFAALPYCGYDEQEPEETIFMLINPLWLSEISYYKNIIKQKESLPNSEIPYYLVYDKNYWMLFVQIVDIKELLTEKRAVFLIGEQSFNVYFEDSFAMQPQIVKYCSISFDYEILMSRILKKKGELIKICKEENEEYYQEHRKEIIQNILSGKPRILFITSRFTTVLQYHTRDCQQAAEKIGCNTRLLIEPDGIHRISGLSYIKCIRDFKPDIIFCIDHFRFEYGAPDNLVWVTWVQDPLPDIMDKKTPEKLESRDFLMNHYITWKEFKNVKYDEKYIIDAPVPANSWIYKPYQLNVKEKERYSCDICFVCHFSDVEKHVENMVSNYTEELQEMIRAVYYGYKSFVYQTSQLFYKEDAFATYIKGALWQHFNYTCSSEMLRYIANDMYMWFNQAVYRQVLVDWLIDAGFKNLKLWGKDWLGNEKYKQYAMGIAENGETLSKIYQASKIVVGNNVKTTGAARAWEAMLSGAFYISNYIPPEEDAVDIRKILKLDGELIMFYNKTDFLHKIEYYLTHEKERKRMIDIGRKVALEKMTFERLMEKAIKEIPKRIAEEECKEK